MIQDSPTKVSSVTTPVEYCEEKYPKMMNEFKAIQKEQYELFCMKQMSYGPHNISVGTRLETEEEVSVSLKGLWFRMFDKISRLKELTVLNVPNPIHNETIEDTYQDLSIYGIIAQLVKRKKWAK